jgi:hypothetical protein
MNPIEEKTNIPAELLQIAKHMVAAAYSAYGLSWETIYLDVVSNGVTVSIIEEEEWFTWTLTHDSGRIRFSLDVKRPDGVVLHAHGSRGEGVIFFNNQTSRRAMSNPSKQSITQRHVFKFKEYLGYLQIATGIVMPDVDEYLRKSGVKIFFLPSGRQEGDLIWYHDHRGGCYVRKPLDGLHYLSTDDDQFRVIWNERGVDMPARSMEEANTIILSLGGK